MNLKNLFIDDLKYNLFLVILFIFISIHALYYFDYFYVPDSDYFDMREKALSFMNFESPRSYARLPLYPLLMGLLSLILPVKHPVLYAAELTNFAAFLVSCILLYLISKRFLDKYAFIVLYLFALHPLTVHMTVQPRAEMLTVMFVLSGIYLACKESKYAYLAAFLASLTRYEGFFLIPGLVIADIVRTRKFMPNILMGIISSSGLIVWVLLNYLSTGHMNPYHHYFSPDIKPAGMTFINVMMIALSRFIRSSFIFNYIPLGIFTIVIASLTIAGFYYLVKKSYQAILPVFVFFICTLLLNLRFFSATPEHAFIVYWIFVLSVAGGIAFISGTAAAKCKELIKKFCMNLNARLFYAVLSFFIFLLLSIGIRSFNKIDNRILYAVSFGIAALFFLINFHTYTVPTLMLSLVFLFPVSFICRENVVSVQDRMNSSRYTKAELRLVGEWYSVHAKSDERIVVSEPWVAGHYAKPADYKKFFFLGDFKSSTHESFVSELKDKNISYIVWDSTHGKLKDDDYFYKFYKIFLLAPLSEGQQREHFTFITTLRSGPQYAHIYKFSP